MRKIPCLSIQLAINPGMILPITEISEVLEIQAGYVDGHMRGGRSGEISYMIDGITITDVYDGNEQVLV